MNIKDSYLHSGTHLVKNISFTTDSGVLKAVITWALEGTEDSEITIPTIGGASFGSQTANYVLAAPNGSAGNPTFRALVAADIPYLDASIITSGTITASLLPMASTSARGAVLIGEAQTSDNDSAITDKKYWVKMNANGKLFVDIPWDNTHYTAIPILGATNATTNATADTANNATFLNIIENNAKSGGIQITGAVGASVKANGGILTITSKWLAANNTQEGYAPQLQSGGTNLADSTNDYVLAFTYSDSGTLTPTWKKLPSNAYLNTWIANDVGVAGYVAAPTKASNANMTWLTDSEGVPAWRDSNNHSHSVVSPTNDGFVSADQARTVLPISVSRGIRRIASISRNTLSYASLRINETQSARLNDIILYFSESYNIVRGKILDLSGVSKDTFTLWYYYNTDENKYEIYLLSTLDRNLIYEWVRNTGTTTTIEDVSVDSVPEGAVEFDWFNIMNSSVSGGGNSLNSSLTVKINGVSYTLTNTWRGILNNLTSTSTTDSLSAALGKALNDKFGSYLPLIGGTVTGAIKRFYSSASDDPMIAMTSNNQDIWLWRINGGLTVSVDTSAKSGFGLKYIGTGSGNDNNLVLYSDNLLGPLVAAITIDLAGLVTLNSTPKVGSTLVSLVGHTHAYTELTGSTTTADLAIVSSGTENGWTLKTLGSLAFDSTAYLPLAGGTMTGPIDVGTVTSTTNLQYVGINFGESARISCATTTGHTALYSVGYIYLRPNLTVTSKVFSASTGLVLTSTTATFNDNLIYHAGNIPSNSSSKKGVVPAGVASSVYMTDSTGTPSWTSYDTTVTLNSGNLVTSGAVYTAIANSVSSAVQYMGTVGSEAEMTALTDAGQGDFARVLTLFTFTDATGNSVTAHVGDVVYLTNNTPGTAANWIVAHTEIDNDTWTAASTSAAGYIPQLATGGIALADSTNDYVLSFVNGTNTTPVWKKLPEKAYTDTWIAWLGATSEADGVAGYMPAPTIADRLKFLRGDGNWCEFAAGQGLSLSGTTFTLGHVWTAITQGNTWSRIMYGACTTSYVGNSGILTLRRTRSGVVTNVTFLITTSHSSNGLIIELTSNNYTPLRIRLVENTGGNFYVELYDSEKSIASGDRQSWYCTYISLTNTNITLYSGFTDGTTIPDGYTKKNDFTTTVGDSTAAIKNISRSGTTFTATRQNGSAFTFTLQDTWIAWTGATDSEDGVAGYMPGASVADRSKFLRGDGTWAELSASSHTHNVSINGTTKAIGSSTVDLGSYLPLSGGILTNDGFYILTMTGGTDGKGVSITYTDPEDSSKYYQGLILFRESDWGMAIANYSAKGALGINSSGIPYYGWANTKHVLAHANNITNSAATIGTDLTTLATIAGVNITAQLPIAARGESTVTSGVITPTDSGETKFLREDGTWQVPDYTTDLYVKLSPTTTASYRGIVLGYNGNTNANTGIDIEVTNLVFVTNKLVVKPSTGDIVSLGRGTFAGLTSTSGDLIFNSLNHILWNSGIYWLRILLTDDSTSNTAVFTFQLSADSGSNWTDLLTIKDNGKILATEFVGALTGNATTASNLSKSGVRGFLYLSGDADTSATGYGTRDTAIIGIPYIHHTASDNDTYVLSEDLFYKSGDTIYLGSTIHSNKFACIKTKNSTTDDWNGSTTSGTATGETTTYSAGTGINISNDGVISTTRKEWFGTEALFNNITSLDSETTYYIIVN